MKLFALGTPTSEAEGLAPILRSDGLHLRILNVVLPDVVFTSWHRTRDPLRDAVCPRAPSACRHRPPSLA